MRVPVRAVVLLAAIMLSALMTPRPSPAEHATGARIVHPVDEADSLAILNELRRNLRADRRDVESRRKLASLLEGSPSIERRREAAEALQEALLVDGEDVDLWVRFARLRERQNFRAQSRSAYRKVTELAPHNGAVWNELAAHELTRYQRFDIRDYLWDAQKSNRRALRYAPDNPLPARRGVRIALMSGDLAAADSLLRRWEKNDPHDAWPHLVRGTLLYDERRWERAGREFRTGMAKLDSLTRREFEVLSIVDPLEEELSSYSADSSRFVSDYWRWRDPTPADDINQRLLEHYSRMVKAEMFFGLEERRIPGWRHGPGEIVVRYGLPRNWHYDSDISRGEARLFAKSSFGVPMINVRFGTDTNPYIFRFVDFAMNGVYTRGMWSGDYFIAQHPSTFEPPFEAPPADQEIEIWRFYDRDGNGRTEVAMALPSADWSLAVLEDPGRLLSRVAVYDEAWNPLDRGMRDWYATEIDAAGRLVGVWEFGGGSDSLIVAVETEDLDGSGRAAMYAPLPPRQTNAQGILLSDVAFLRSVSFPPGENDPYARYGGRGLPNPGHRYFPGEAVGLGFEVYHLATDETGRHRARISVTVSRTTRRGLFRVLLGDGGSGESELTFDSEAPGITLRQLLSVELPVMSKGKYQLHIEVHDLLDSTRTVRVDPFEIVAPPKGTE